MVGFFGFGFGFGFGLRFLVCGFWFLICGLQLLALRLGGGYTIFRSASGWLMSS